MFIFSILSFIFGASIGSFTQVVASRLHVAPIAKARSKCLSCGQELRPLDLIPLLSYFLLKGKCRHCKTKYGVTALVIEGIYGLIFLLLYHYLLQDIPSFISAISWFLYYTALFIVLGVMALYDKAHSYIPLSFLWGYLALSGIKLFINFSEIRELQLFLAPIFVATPFFFIWVITKGKGLGFGDVLLFLGVGAFFGSLQGFAVLVISVWLGALFGLYYKFILNKKTGSATAIPFVPFIVIAFLIVLFTDIDILSIALYLS